MTNSEILNALNAIQAQLNVLFSAVGGSQTDAGAETVLEVSLYGGRKLGRVEAYKATLSPAVAARIPKYFMCEDGLDTIEDSAAQFTVRSNCNRALFTLLGNPYSKWIEACNYSRSFFGSPVQGELLPDHGAVVGANQAPDGSVNFLGIKLDEILGIVKKMAAEIATDLKQPVFPNSKV